MRPVFERSPKSEARAATSVPGAAADRTAASVVARPGLRVLIACDWHLKYAAGLATGLRRAGADVAFLCRTHAREFGGSHVELEQVLDALRQSGVAVILLPGKISSFVALPGLVGALRQVRAWRPDVVHVQENWDPRLLLFARGYPLVVTVHDPALHPGEADVARWEAAVWRRWLRRADKIVVHGEALREPLPPFVSRAAVAVIAHGIESQRSPMPPPPEPAVLLYGRLAKYKGLNVLFEAMQLVWQQRPDTRLLVYGRGPDAAAIPSDARIEASIGYLPEADEDGMFARASLVVLPYIGGSQSGVGVRSLIRGIPTVVSDVGALAELALDESFVVRAGDANGLAAALLRHLDHDATLRRRVFDFAHARFGWDAVASRTLELYEKIASEGSGGREAASR
jgi:glycosyltransferase involved in cell wall biosynthesis